MSFIDFLASGNWKRPVDWTINVKPSRGQGLTEQILQAQQSIDIERSLYQQQAYSDYDFYVRWRTQKEAELYRQMYEYAQLYSIKLKPVLNKDIRIL
jgi:hypothetical protein